MRAVVVIDELQEIEIRPRELFDRYLALLAEDIAAYFARDLIEVVCPGCGATDSAPAFAKFGMTYRSCATCFTLFISPRPVPSAIARYHQEAPSARFWRDVLVPETDEKRLAHILRPRAEWLADAVAEFLPRPRRLFGLGPTDAAFLEEVIRIGAVDEVLSTVPDGGMPDGDESSRRSISVVTAFDVLERAFDPHPLLDSAWRLLAPGGLLVLTTRTSSGFDVQILWDQARHIVPTVHMNLLSVDALQTALGQHGFTPVELSTPGQLDVDVVLNRLRENPQLPVPRFVAYLLQRRGEDARQALQEYLQRFRLSSYARVVARKS